MTALRASLDDSAAFHSGCDRNGYTKRHQLLISRSLFLMKTIRAAVKPIPTQESKAFGYAYTGCDESPAHTLSVRYALRVIIEVAIVSIENVCALAGINFPPAARALHRSMIHRENHVVFLLQSDNFRAGIACEADFPSA
jgi:hypothetical protein